MVEFTPIVETTGKIIDGIGVLVVVLSLAVTVFRFFATMHKRLIHTDNSTKILGVASCLGLSSWLRRISFRIVVTS